jgi:DNA-binding GntR family transcriptional regulator
MPKTLRHKAYDEIKRRILSLEVKPGEKLSDTQISGALRMGRTPVREAFLMLEREKLVQCDGKQGYFVKKITKKEAEQYFAMRTALELFAVPAIIEGATPSILKELQSNIKKSERCARQNDVHGMAIYNTKFDETIYKATNSDVFIETMSGLLDRLHWLRMIALRASKGSRQSLEDHKRIVQAVQNKNPNELRKAIRQHLRHAREKCMAMADIIL